MQIIKISQGYECTIDDEDFQFINSHKWKVLRSRKRIYASYSYGEKGNKSMLMHRLILDAKKGEYVDHINGNTLDNRRENLRLCTNSENLGNRGKQTNNTTGYKGVYKTESPLYYRCAIRKDNMVYCLGTLKDKEKCAKLYDAASLHFYGEFAYLNFPELLEEYKEINKTKDYSLIKANKSYYNYKKKPTIEEIDTI